MGGIHPGQALLLVHVTERHLSISQYARRTESTPAKSKVGTPSTTDPQQGYIFQMRMHLYVKSPILLPSLAMCSRIMQLRCGTHVLP